MFCVCLGTVTICVYKITHTHTIYRKASRGSLWGGWGCGDTHSWWWRVVLDRLDNTLDAPFWSSLSTVQGFETTLGPRTCHNTATRSEHANMYTSEEKNCPVDARRRSKIDVKSISRLWNYNKIDLRWLIFGTVAWRWNERPRGWCAVIISSLEYYSNYEAGRERDMATGVPQCRVPTDGPLDDWGYSCSRVGDPWHLWCCHDVLTSGLVSHMWKDSYLLTMFWVVRGRTKRREKATGIQITEPSPVERCQVFFRNETNAKLICLNTVLYSSAWLVRSICQGQTELLVPLQVLGIKACWYLHERGMDSNIVWKCFRSFLNAYSYLKYL